MCNIKPYKVTAPMGFRQRCPILSVRLDEGETVWPSGVIGGPAEARTQMPTDEWASGQERNQRPHPGEEGPSLGIRRTCRGRRSMLLIGSLMTAGGISVRDAPMFSSQGRNRAGDRISSICGLASLIR